MYVYFRWKGSIYKLVWIDSIVYFCLYFLIAIIYHAVLQDEQQKRCDILFLCIILNIVLLLAVPSFVWIYESNVVSTS